MTTLKIKRMHENFKAPVYATLGAAAFDLHAIEDLVLDIHPVKTKLGFAAEVPEGHVALIAPRSGQGFNYGLHLRNTIGIIDSDYRGEWNASLSIDLFNGHEYLVETGTLEETKLHIKAGDRFLQCLIIPVTQVDIAIVDKLSETERGEGGLGHTGV